MNLKLKAIPGYQYYYAETGGNIYSVTPEIPQKFFDLARIEIIETSPGKFHSPKTGFIKIKKLKPQENSTGYLRVILALDGNKTREFVHRLILLTFKGKFPPNKETNHKDGNIHNNKLSNLEFVTHAENIKHSRKLQKYDITKSVEGAF